MTTFADDCAELGDLWPRLRAALTKDTTGTKGSQVTAGTVVNPEVLRALIELGGQIPATATHVADLGGEQWPKRPVDVCLVNLPRFHSRLMDLAHVRDAAQLEAAVFHWLRLAKLALRLIDPSWDLPPWVVCTAHETPVTRLRHIGAERAIVYESGEPRAVLVRDGYWLCPHCGATWPQSHWELLIAALMAPVRRAS